MPTRKFINDDTVPVATDQFAELLEGAAWPVEELPHPETTGRLLITFRPEARGREEQLLRSFGFKTASVAEGEPLLGALDLDSAVVIDEYGIAVVIPEPGREQWLTVNAEPGLFVVEQERRVHAFPDLEAFLRGFRDGVETTVDKVRLQITKGEVPPIMPGGQTVATGSPAFVDGESCTWGLQAIGAAASRFRGLGTRIAILDTGLDPAHADFSGRQITGKSFVAATPTTADGHGHGTHCAGIACGPEKPADAPRYGVASQAELLVGKVLDDAGAGADGDILNGIRWAADAGCHAISLSLGAPVARDTPHSAAFEATASRVLAKGSVIVAAAGNESRRSKGVIAPVAHPANCPSILAVGAVGPALAVADFSCASDFPVGGQVGLAAPGVDILSAITGSARGRKSGTSMATPFVAGALALLAEELPGERGRLLVARLLARARRLPLASLDVGMGLLRV